MQLKQFSILHEDFTSTKFCSRNFLIFDLLRHILLVLEIVAFYQYPLASIICIVATQLIWIVYFNIILQPFVIKRMFWISLMLETLTNTGIICALALIIFDIKQYNDKSVRMNLGSFIFVIFILLKNLFSMKNSY